VENADIASALLSIAERLGLEKGTLFRARAYERAARVVARQSSSVAEMLEAGTLRDLPGIGASIEGVVREIVERGRARLQTALEERYPAALVALTRVEGITPDRARRIYDTLGIESVEALEKAVQDGRIRAVKGFGEKVSARLGAALARRRNRPDRVNIARATRIAEETIAALSQRHPAARVEVTGAVRRCDPLCDRVLILVASEGDPNRVLDDVAALPLGGMALDRGPDRITWQTYEDVIVHVIVVEPADRVGALLWHTPSAAARAALARRADERGAAYHERARWESEEAFFAALDLPWLPPELLDDPSLSPPPADLLTLDDIRGDLHAHTVASDGKNTVEEMARAALERGLEYLAITDHSRSLAIAHGLTVDRLLAQGEEIDALRIPGLRVLKGTECDILPDGSLDFPDHVLDRLDVVVASIHSHFRLDRETQTRRLIRAIENPRVDVIGHPSGRLLLHREPYDVDWDAVLEAAIRSGTALELNASPSRLDVDAACAARLAQGGGSISIDSDAHSIRELGYMRFGVGQARRARMPRGAVLNARPLEGLGRKRR
jgi:DNA polymerase (family 10)